MSNTRYNEIPLKAALYVRLSKEDRNKVNKEDDSESIVNQQNMLIDYCRQKEWIVYDIYNDEDFSGSDRDRPDFNRMINDARENKFDVIICKTQSRFARDMEMIEKYINRLFPVWGIRFLSIVDNNDSSNKANRKSRQINALVDQWYLEDLSDNIRATLSSKRRQGLWVGAFAPYGYIKSPDNPIRHEQELSATLREQQKIILEKIKDNHTKLMSLGERDAFCRGFSLAVRLMIDSMSDKT